MGNQEDPQSGSSALETDEIGIARHVEHEAPHLTWPCTRTCSLQVRATLSIIRSCQVFDVPLGQCVRNSS